MNKTPFADISTAANQQERSHQWYVQAIRQYARGINTFDEAKQTDIGKVSRRLEIGKMYMYSYDPKHKATLPYYDTCPLVVIVEPTSNGFSGINFHYLPVQARAELLDRLVRKKMPWDQDMDQDEATLKANWAMLKNFGRFPETRGSIKQYLSRHITGQMIEVDYKHWKTAVYLPVQDFVGATERTVYKNSMDTKRRDKRKING